ncbi:MAG TPA: response regulator [Gemmataceae bacterium]|nr:response regulator [Gemmataceae bacterium]
MTARPLRILVAEDNPINQLVAVRLLDKHGHTVAVACNGREAVAAVQGGGFDLVLMDIQMPEMDGFQATDAIRGSEQLNGGHLPIVALTAHALAGDRENCLSSGMDGYLAKPYTAEELNRVLYDVMQIAPTATQVTYAPTLCDA